MNYLMIFTDRMEDIEALSMEARGELLTMCMAYCADESLVVTAADFKTEAKFLWPSFRRMIDTQRESSERQTANGSKGGRPKKNQENQVKPEETHENPNETQQNPQKPSNNPTKPTKSPVISNQ